MYFRYINSRLLRKQSDSLELLIQMDGNKLNGIKKENLKSDESIGNVGDIKSRLNFYLLIS